MSRKSASRKPAQPRPERAKKASSAGSESQAVRGEVRQGVQWVTVDEDNDGQRVDNFLLAQLRGVPKSIIYRVIRKGEVRVNKGRVKPDSRVRTGDQVRIPPITRKEKPDQVAPGSRVQGVMESAVVFENEQMLRRKST